MAKIKLYDNAGISESLNLIGDSGYVSLLGMFHHFSLKKRLHNPYPFYGAQIELLSNVVYGILKRRPVFDRQFV